MNEGKYEKNYNIKKKNGKNNGGKVPTTDSRQCFERDKKKSGIRKKKSGKAQGSREYKIG
jgi:hypothetical protein